MRNKVVIYKQDAIDAVADGLKRVFVENRDVAEILLKSVPSAQTDIILCKDCKRWSKTTGNKGRCMDIYDDGILWDADDFCSYAERKE